MRLPDGDLRYEWSRKRVKNRNLRIRPDGSVTLSTPWGISGAEADRFVREQAAWIAAARRRLAERRPSPLADGAALSVAGEAVRLRIEAGGSGPARWGRGTLTVPVAAGLSPDEEEVAVRDALRQALLAPAERELASLLARCLPLVETETGRGGAPPVLTLRWMRSRWGSCVPGRNRITLNAALILAPPECAAYVVIHELCHRIHPDHSAAFHRLAAQVLKRAGLPEEKTLRRRLRESGAAAWLNRE